MRLSLRMMHSLMLSRRLRVPLLLALLSVPLAIPADFWVDPPPSTPMEWCRSEQPSYSVGGEAARYQVETLPPKSAPAKPASETEEVEGYDKKNQQTWEEVSTSKPNPTKKLLENVKAPIPNRLMTADIWCEWQVTRIDTGWGNWGGY